jgi:uncharacterized protein (DUF433 family)
MRQSSEEATRFHGLDLTKRRVGANVAGPLFQLRGFNMSSLIDRITVDPMVCHGQPCVKGTRVMVWLILNFLANGDKVEDILVAYPGITREDIQACLAYG